MSTNTRKRSRTSKPTPLQVAEEYLLSLELHTLLTRFQRDRPSQPDHLSHAILKEYRRFLTLKVVHSDQHAGILSPSPLVDAIWHMHILDTAAYSDMCSKLPFFVHHDPDGGLNALIRQYRYGTTLHSYREKWGEPDVSIWPQKLEIPQSVQKRGKYVNIVGSTGEEIRLNLDPEDPALLVVHVKDAFAKAVGVQADDIRLTYDYERMF